MELHQTFMRIFKLGLVKISQTSWLGEKDISFGLHEAPT